MAILRGPFGTGYVGRLGANVGQKAGNGRYKIYAYQPDVRNPRTYSQRVQRAKFSFLGQMAGIYTDAGLVGLERQPYKSVRTAFMSLNMPNVVMGTAPDDETVNVGASAEAIKLSKGYEPAPQMLPMMTSYTNMKLSATTFYNGLDAAPDVFIYAIVVDKGIGVDDYVAQVGAIAYTNRDSSRARITAQDITVRLDGITYLGQRLTYYVYGYNMRYAGGRTGASANTLSADPDAAQLQFELTSVARNLYSKHLYSPTALAKVTHAEQ